MLLVVDANVFTSALIARGFTLDLFFSDKLQLLVPDWIFTEIGEHKDEILEKAGISEEELALFINLLIIRVELTPAEDLREWLNKAKEISPDPDDAPYFALALKFNCGIWSNDAELKEQSVVSVLTTEDVKKLVGL